MSLVDMGVQRLRATVTDGRCRNIRYRQKQLESLYEGLVASASALCDAIAKDSQSSNVEVEAEFSFAMAAIRHFYDDLDFEEALHHDYNTTRGKDHMTRRLGVGLVAIRPSSHTRLYSTLTAIAAAVAAGNCVILELGDSLFEVDAILKQLLPKFLDHDSFLLSTSRIPDQELKPCLLVDQQSPVISGAPRKDVLSSSTARVVAVVDRTADIDAAACCLVHARYTYQGTSPYAPDLVLVNGFVKKQFIEACMRYATTQFVASDVLNKISSNAKLTTQGVIREAEKNGQLSTYGTSDFMLVDILNRQTSVATMKITGRYLVLMEYTSMTDAISSQGTGTTFLAGYFFARVDAGNFLSQYVDCHMSFINQIPFHLLIGPAATISQAPSLPYRYSTDMFSVLRPQIVEAPSDDILEISNAIEKPSATSLRQLRYSAVIPLNTKPQPLGKAVGFFEQGLLLGLGVVFSVVVPVLGYGAYYIGRKSFALLMRKNQG